MLLELVTGIGATKFVKDMMDADETEKQALEKYNEAFEKQSEAKLLIQQKKEYTDKRLKNVEKKKSAILSVALPRFVEVYGKIQKIEIHDPNRLLLTVDPKTLQQLDRIQSISIVTPKQLSDQESMIEFAFRGISGSIAKDAERRLSASRSQLSAAKVAYAQAESVAEVYAAIAERADRISRLLATMNMLFLRSIEETESTIRKNGTDVRNYTQYDKAVLMTCVNFAFATIDVLKIRVVDKNGTLYNAALPMIEQGEKYIAAMNRASNL